MLNIRPRVWPSLLRRLLRQRVPLDYWLLGGRAFWPSQISVDLTYRCNARCRMCCQAGPETLTIPSRSEPGGFLERAAFEAVLAELRPLRPTVYLTGGEPLLHPEATALAALARAFGLYVSINTNGLLLEERGRELAEAGVDRVILSVAPAPDLCESERGVPYQRLLAGVRSLRPGKAGRRPLLVLTCVITPANCGRLNELAGLARELGANGVTLQHLMFSDETHIRAHAETLKSVFGEDVPFSGLATPAGAVDVEAVRRGVRALRAAGVRLRLEPNVPEAAWPAYYTSLAVLLRGRCLAPWTTLALMPDGGLSCCRPLRLGRAGMDMVRSVWNNDRAVAFRRRIRQGLLPGCVRCCSRAYGRAD
jgi:MoaA/NifB/PqqE/SkfB family radical SAM enzyme